MSQAALEYAAQKSQGAATDIMFSIRHKKRADRNAASQNSPGTVGGKTGIIQYKFRIICFCGCVFSQQRTRE